MRGLIDLLGEDEMKCLEYKHSRSITAGINLFWFCMRTSSDLLLSEYYTVTQPNGHYFTTSADRRVKNKWNYSWIEKNISTDIQNILPETGNAVQLCIISAISSKLN